MPHVVGMEPQFPEGAFVAIDLDTTGLNAGRDAAVAVAVVPFRGGEPASGYETLVNPGRPIPATSTRIHGITDAELRALGEVVAARRRPRTH